MLNKRLIIYKDQFATAPTYIDNIICKVKFLNNLLSILYFFFEIFITYNISIKPIKIFFNYPNVKLLDQ